MIDAIYFDMDGTIANLYGVENWLDDLHNENVRPYAEATPLVDMIALNNVCETLQSMGVVIGVISWSAMGGSKEYNAQVRKVKKEWIANNLPCVTEFHVVKYGTPKHKVRKINNSILIDDCAEVRDAWDGLTINATKNFVKMLDMLAASVLEQSHRNKEKEKKMTINEITNVREMPYKEKKPIKITVWENLQLVGLGMTILGQIIIGGSYLLGQGVWLAANVLALTRDFVLLRPAADKIKNACLTALTLGLVLLRVLGWY